MSLGFFTGFRGRSRQMAWAWCLIFVTFTLKVVRVTDLLQNCKMRELCNQSLLKKLEDRTWPRNMSANWQIDFHKHGWVRQAASSPGVVVFDSIFEYRHKQTLMCLVKAWIPDKERSSPKRTLVSKLYQSPSIDARLQTTFVATSRYLVGSAGLALRYPFWTVVWVDFMWSSSILVKGNVQGTEWSWSRSAPRSMCQNSSAKKKSIKNV